MNVLHSKGLKASNVKARAEGPGMRPYHFPQGLKGGPNHGQTPAAHVPPLQGGSRFHDTYSRGFTPGYPMTGFQPT